MNRIDRCTSEWPWKVEIRVHLPVLDLNGNGFDQ